jgi:putative ABC transport system permease protein
MFRNYLTIAFRNLSKRKGYAILNVLGLVVGMTCCLLIFHYVSFERSYDSFQPKSGDIVRVRLDS